MITAVLTAMIVGVTAYGLHRIVLRYETENLRDSKNPLPGPDTNTFVPPPVPASLGDAIRLLPEPQYAQDGRAINENLYYVHLQKPNPDEALLTPVDEAWLVDVKAAKATLFASRPLGFPYGASVGYAETMRGADGGGKFSARWGAGWEGGSHIIEDVFDIRTGTHLVTTELVDGTLAIVSSQPKRVAHRIVLAPENGCAGKAHGETVSVTGLLIDGRLHAFPSAQRVSCINDEMLGATFYPNFDYLVVSTNGLGEPGEKIVRLGLPGGNGNNAELPLETLDPDKIAFPNWR